MSVHGSIHGWKHNWAHNWQHGTSLFGYAPVPPGPGLIWVGGQSGALGFGVAANMTDFPDVVNQYANVQCSRYGATNANPPTWFAEAPQNLQPRTQAFSSYVAGTCGIELQMGRALDAIEGGWGITIAGMDASGLEDEWMNPAFPVSGGQFLDQMFARIDAMIIAHNKPLKIFVHEQGEADMNELPDATDYFKWSYQLYDRIRRKYGNIGIVICRRHQTEIGTDGTRYNVRDTQESLARALPRTLLYRTDDCGLRDAAHLADDAGGVKGYCTAGNRAAVKVRKLTTYEATPLNPRWGAQGIPVIVAAGSAITPLKWPKYHAAGDIGVAWVTALGNTAYPTPAGWTALASSPQHDGADALASRLQIFTKTATSTVSIAPDGTTSGGEADLTIADVGGDDFKAGGIFTIVGSSGVDDTHGDFVASGTAISVPGGTTTGSNRLVLAIAAFRVDQAVPQVTGWANADLTEVEEELDLCYSSSTGFGIAVMSGVKTVGGPYGASTATLANAGTQARISVSFKP